MWAGRDGTLLIWTWATSLTLVLERYFHKEKEMQRELTSLIGMGLLLALCTIQLFINPFGLNETTPTTGNGLNPLLLSPYMIIHPPIVFVSYGMIVFLYASAMSFLITEDKSWNNTIKRWGRGSWIGMSLALIIGGYWAYVTLGWGGYWAWDPVETAGLLPWFAMTTLLHTSVMSRRKKDYRILGPLLSMLTFVLVLLESFVTRGGIWSSVHSFIVEDNGGTWSRLNYVLENDVSVRGFFILMILSSLITIAIIGDKYRKRKFDEKTIQYDSVEKILSEDNNTIIAIGERTTDKNLPNVEIFRCGKDEINLQKLINHLGEKGIKNILVEGGETVLWSFLEKELFDELNIFISNIIIGGKETPTIAGGKGYANAENTLKLKLDNIEKLGDGILVKYSKRKN